MQRFTLIGLMAALLLSLTLIPVQAQPKDTVGGEDVAADGVLVKWKAGHNTVNTQDATDKIGGRVVRKFKQVGWQQVKLPQGMKVQDALAQYKAMSDVAAVEPNYLYHTTATPNDPSFSSLWGMKKIDAPTAWDTTTGSKDVVAVVLDTGVEYSHPDLAANMWKNPGEIAGNGVDDDGNGYIDDVYGIDTANNDSDPMDDKGHGTHVAGTIGAVGNNGVGVAGVNWNVKIMALKFMDSTGSGSTADAVAAYDYAINMKKRGVNIRVVSNSWGGGGYSSALDNAMTAAGNAGIVSVCAAGNGGSDGVGDNNDTYGFYPGNYASPSIITVAASDQYDNRASFSNYGAATVDLATPGVSITSTYPGGRYASMSGTSMATPHVSGAVALLFAKDPSLSVAAVKAALLNTVDKSAAWSGKVVSGGRMNVAKALQSIGGGTTPPPTSTYQPDLLIRANSVTTAIGGNVYGTLTGQTVGQSVAAGATAIYQITLQNDGNAADSITLGGPAAQSGWTVRYFNATSGGTDITGQMTGTGWTISLAAGATQAIRVEVTPGSGVVNGAVQDILMTASSQGDTSKTDLVKATTTATVATTTKVTSVTLTASPTSPRPANTAITLTANATGATAEYQFRVGRLTTSGWTWTMLRDYDTGNTVTWTPTQTGSYSIRVYARAVGSTASYDTYRAISYSVTTPTVSRLTAMTLTASPLSPQPVGSAITLTATATGGAAEYQFRVGYYSNGTWTWTTLSDYSTNNTVVWQPTKAGTYSIRAYARAAGSGRSYDLYRYLSYSIR